LGIELFGKGESKVALQLFRLASESFPSITSTSTTSQLAQAFFRTMSADVTAVSGVAYSLAVTTWFDGDGTGSTAFPTGQGLTSLCINGVLQQPGLYTVNADAVVITAASSFVLVGGYPVTLQTYNVNASMSVVVSALASSLVAIP
jgi:hypothetical protein